MPANIDASAGSVAELERIVSQIRAQWPDTKIIIRGDSGFCREALGRFRPRTGQKLTLAEDEFAGPEGGPPLLPTHRRAQPSLL